MAGKYSLDQSLENHLVYLEDKYSLPKGLLKAVAYTESRYNPNAISPVGAEGLFQFMPATAKQYKVDVKDPVSSANGAAKMYSDLLRANGGDLPSALAGYNWGQGNLQKKGLANAPKETKNYISQITGLLGNQVSQKKNNVNSDSLDPNQFPPELWNAYFEQKKMQEAGTKASLPQQQAQPQETLDPNQFSQQEWDAYFAAKQQSEQPVVANPIPATTPNGGMPAPNPIAQVQGDPQSQQNVLSTQASGIAFQPQNTQQNNIGPVLYGKLLQLKNNPDAFADFYMGRTPAEKALLNKAIQEEGAKNPDQPGAFANFGEGLLMRTSQDVNNSVEQVGNSIKGFFTGDKTGSDALNLKMRRQEALREVQDLYDPSKARTAGNIAGEIATAAVLPGARLVTGTGKIASALGSRVGDIALKSAAAGAVANPVSGDDVLYGKVKQAGLNAALGVGASKVIDKVAPIIAKPFNKLSAADEAAQAAAKKEGITLLASDLPSASNALRKKGNNLARDEEAVNNVVSTNQEAAEKAIKDLVNDTPIIDKAKYIKDKGLDGTINKENVEAAKSVVDKINKLDSADPNVILKTTSEANFLSKKIANDAQYAEASRLAPVDKFVPLNNSQKALNSLQNRYDKTILSSDKEILKPVLDDFKEAIGSGKVNYSEADQLFSSFGSKARDTKNESIKRLYTDFKSAINTDKDAFVNSLPNDPALMAYKTAYSAAKSKNLTDIQSIKNDESLRNLMLPFNRNNNPNLPDNLISDWVKKGEKQKVKVLFNNLDDEAKGAVQKGVLNKLINSATTQSGGFNPKAFNKAYKAYADPASGNTPLDVVFDAKTHNRLKELMGVFDNLHSVGFNKLNPQTGVQSVLTLQNLGRAAAVTAAPFTHGLSLVLPIFNSIKKMGVVKAMTNPGLNKYLLDITNTNPNSKKYIEKVAQYAALLAAQQQ